MEQKNETFKNCLDSVNYHCSSKNKSSKEFEPSLYDKIWNSSTERGAPAIQLAQPEPTTICVLENLLKCELSIR